MQKLLIISIIIGSVQLNQISAAELSSAGKARAFWQKADAQAKQQSFQMQMALQKAAAQQKAKAATAPKTANTPSKSVNKTSETPISKEIKEKKEEPKLTVEQIMDIAERTLSPDHKGDINHYLSLAVMRNDHELVKLLLSTGLIDLTKLRYDPILEITSSYLAMTNNKKIIDLFIQHGADIDQQDQFGNTALIEAVCNLSAFLSPEKISYLLDLGAKIDIANKEGRTFLTLINLPARGKFQPQHALKVYREYLLKMIEEMKKVEGLNRYQNDLLKIIAEYR